MKKVKTIYITLLALMFSFTILQASEMNQLKLEDAIIKAEGRNKKLRVQGTNIELSKVNAQDAKENHDKYWNEQTSAGYTQARAKYDHDKKSEEVIKDEVAYNMEKQFDTIMELEEKHELASKSLYIQRQKANLAVRKEQLGIGSKADSKAEQTKLEVQNKEMESLVQALNAEYRKLNDAIGGKDPRYNLVKENIYRPLEMKRSLPGQVSYAIDSDPGIKLQEEMAKSQEIIIYSPDPSPAAQGGAPTWNLVQQRKLGYQQAMNNVSLSKEGKEEQIKQLYENILALEIQYDKYLVELEEARRQYEFMAKRHELGMISDLNLQEMELSLLQNKIQINSTIRQHNQLKVLFEKSYIGTGQMK